MEKIRTIATNRRASRDYEISERFEAGIALEGSEVKSIRQGMVNIKDSFARVRDGEVFVFNMHISPYSHADRRFIDPERTRKLLMRKREISYLFGKTREKGLTLIPLKVYIRGRYVKLELGLARGKKVYDKRDDVKTREARREIDRAIKKKLK
ncbi:MAG: SsrA-binding protein SmpB [Deltaproteobacteria bacterium]|nr:SsrA-binding protein SmpB [Deltaproteobacteria bacterium]NIS77065.1 SsrA-binding protein SmpB [Deltaproteobacteria bacterium]